MKPKQKRPKTASVKIDDDLRANAKMVAAKLRITLQSFVEDAVRAKLKLAARRDLEQALNEGDGVYRP